MEKELQDYIENLKSRSMDTKGVRKAILTIKKSLDDLFDCCEEEIADGEITKKQLVEEFLEEYKKELVEPENYQARLTYLLSQYESCKKLLKLGHKDRGGFQAYINEAKRREVSNPKESLYNSINMKEQIITTLRYAMRDIKHEKKAKRRENPDTVTFEEMMEKLYEMRGNIEEELKDKMIPSIQKRIFFLEEYGYIDDYIDETNNALKNVGLPGIVQVKRNPFPDVEYDRDGNIRNTEEFEDMGVIDVFDKANLRKYSPEDLLVLELFWKSQYFTERLEVSEALAAIEFLDLWPMIMEEDASAIEGIDDTLLSNALKRDLALTYLMRNKDALTPEIEEKYLKFLKENGMAQTTTTMEEIQAQAEEFDSIFSIANDIALGECVVIDKLKNKEIDAKQWGTVEPEKFEDADPVHEKLIVAMEMSAFRGPLIISLNEESLTGFMAKKDGLSREPQLKLPKYKGLIDNEYSKAMASLFLPTSVYFKKYVSEKYAEKPETPLYAQLAVDFAGAKKIKPGKKVSAQTQGEDSGR